METPVVPVMESPAVEIPPVEIPDVTIPEAEVSVEAPEVEAPIAEAPVVEVPVVEAPVAGQEESPIVIPTNEQSPIVEQPVMEQPVMGQPMMEQPIMGQPMMEQPVMGQPMMEQPVMGQPMMEQPVMGQPPMGQPMYGQAPQQPKKKKKVGLIIGIISALIIAIIAIVVAIVLIISGKTTSIDLKDYVKIEFDGYDSMGTLYVELDDDKLIDDILKAQDEKKASSSLRLLIEGITLEVTPRDSLSNGDEIKVEISYSEKQMEDNKLEFKNDEITYTVEGLIPLTEVDPFADITVEFSGTSPNGWASWDNDSSISCVDNSWFTFDKEDGLKNGDVITLTIDESDVEWAVQEGYVFTVKSKEYTVEGLGFYYQSLDEISDEHMDEFKEMAEEEINIDYSWNDASVTNLNHVGTYFAVANDEDEYTSNYVILMYSATLTSNSGAFQPTEIYIPVKISNLQVDEDGELYWPYETTLGTFRVEGSFYTMYGYLTGYDFYVQNIESNVNYYTFEASEGMPDFSQPPVVEDPTALPGETSSEGESQVPTDGGSVAPSAGTEAGETETTAAAEAA